MTAEPKWRALDQTSSKLVSIPGSPQDFSFLRSPTRSRVYNISGFDLKKLWTSDFHQCNNCESSPIPPFFPPLSRGLSVSYYALFCTVRSPAHAPHKAGSTMPVSRGLTSPVAPTTFKKGFWPKFGPWN